MKILVAGGLIVNEGRQFAGCLATDGDRIVEITEGNAVPRGGFDVTIDASGCVVMPGVIDSHVHFREPGLTHKGDIESESRAAAYGGVTSFFDMPNTVPPTTDSRALADKFATAKRQSHVNYSFFPGATADNTAFLQELDCRRVPGIKLFMGASTGNMLVSGRESLERIFRTAHEKGLVLMAHCEDTEMINRNMARYRELLSSADPDISYHPMIRSAEACYASSSLGAELARTYGTRLHVAHISTARELSLLGGNITGEACLSYLLFDDGDYARLGARIKCNPAIKTATDKAALRQAVKRGEIMTVATDHAPHLLSEKEGGAARAMSGMPFVQFSLPALLTIAGEDNMPLTRVAELMCHNPARLFSVSERGFLRKGYKADIAIVRRKERTVGRADIQSKCGWSPIEGCRLAWQVAQTICNGHIIYNDGTFDAGCRGEEITFDRR